MIAVFRALRYAARAQEALYPLAAKLPPVSDFFIDPPLREDADLKARLAAPAKENTGVIHDRNEPGSHGGLLALCAGILHSRARLAAGDGAAWRQRQRRGFLWSWLRDARSYGASWSRPRRPATRLLKVLGP